MKRARPSKSAGPLKLGRLSLRLSEHLLGRIHTIAKTRGVTLTRLVEDHFRSIVAAEDAKATAPYDAESI